MVAKARWPDGKKDVTRVLGTRYQKAKSAARVSHYPRCLWAPSKPKDTRLFDLELIKAIYGLHQNKVVYEFGPEQKQCTPFSRVTCANEVRSTIEGEATRDSNLPRRYEWRALIDVEKHFLETWTLL